jgi:carboxymethylenebutenolidase
VVDIALPYFVATPAAPPPWAGVIVIHEGPGISPQLLRVCQRLAAEGYAAIAPDLFFRSGGTQAGPYSDLITSLVPDEIRGDLGIAAAHLRELGAVKIGVTGFCMGGALTYRAATSDLDVSCAASFYGARISLEKGRPKCPVLIFYGGDDEYISPEEIAAVQERHGDDVVVYPTAQHGFMRDGSDNFDEAAATDAWKRLLAFFGEHLR